MSRKRPERIPLMAAVMTPFPWSVRRGDSVEQAKALMHERGIRHLPVTDGDAPIGLVTDRDIGFVEDVVRRSPAPEPLAVRDVGVRAAYVVELTEPLDAVLAEMASRHSDSALVTKRGRLVGIFTATDAYRHFGEFLRSIYESDGGDAA